MIDALRTLARPKVILGVMALMGASVFCYHITDDVGGLWHYLWAVGFWIFWIWAVLTVLYQPFKHLMLKAYRTKQGGILPPTRGT